MDKKNIFKNLKRGVAGLLIGGMIAGGAHGAIKNRQQSEQIEDLRATISQLQDDKSNTQHQDYVTAGQMSGLIAEIADINKKLSQNQSNTNNNASAIEVAELKGQITGLISQLNTLIQNNANNQSKIEALEKEISILNNTLSTVQSNLNLSSSEILCLKEQIASLQAQLNNITSNNQKPNEEETAEIADKLTEENLLALESILEDMAEEYDYLKIEAKPNHLDTKGLVGFSKENGFMCSQVPSENYGYYMYSDEERMHDADTDGDCYVESNDTPYTIENMPAGVLPDKEYIISCTFDEEEGAYVVITEYENLKYYISSGVIYKVLMEDKLYNEDCEAIFTEITKEEYDKLYAKIKAECDKLIAEYQSKEEQGLTR